jgi:hypothetical protein
LAGESNRNRAERIGKDKRKGQKKGLLRETFQSVNFATVLLSWKKVIDPLTLQGRGVLFFKSHLQFNHGPVHETHSAKVRKTTTTSKTPSLTRIVKGLGKRGNEMGYERQG